MNRCTQKIKLVLQKQDKKLDHSFQKAVETTTMISDYISCETKIEVFDLNDLC